MNKQAIETLNKVKDSIRKHPEEFDMSVWDCGTAACIAGWVCRHTQQISTGSAEAAKAMGVRREEVYSLWFTDHWPERLSTAYGHAKCNYEKAEIACQAIDAFINNPLQFGDRASNA